MGQTPAEVARSSHAWDVLKVLEDKKNYVYPRNTIKELDVMDAGMAALNGKYSRMSAASIPSGFRSVCEQQGWDTKKMWNQLNGPTNPWFKVWPCACTMLCLKTASTLTRSQYTSQA